MEKFHRHDVKCVLKALKAPGQIAWCRWAGSRYGELVDPPEIFIKSISAWVRGDGSRVSFDISRNFRMVRPTLYWRWRLRRAIRKWNAQCSAQS
jgi:hypothetical protein